MILRNAWYVAATSNEVGENQLLARTLLNEQVVLWRSGGKVAALADRCTHRGVPLSLGKVVDGALQCGYHGVCFDTQGACVRIPGQSVPNSALPVTAYTLVERHGFVWLWFGDPALADADLIPDLHVNDDPGWAAPGDLLYVKAAHELLVENLNNHAHVPFVHPQIGASDMADAKSELQRNGDRVESKHWMMNTTAPPHFAKAGNFTGPVDRWFHVTFIAPTTVVVDIGCAVAGTGAENGKLDHAIEFSLLHLLTPETETTTHYFWVYARNFAVDSAAVTEQIRATATLTFGQDVAILESQQRSFDRNPDAPLMNMTADAAPIIVARLRDEIAARQLRELASR